jgi:hypothetical protein
MTSAAVIDRGVRLGGDREKIGILPASAVPAVSAAVCTPCYRSGGSILYVSCDPMDLLGSPGWRSPASPCSPDCSSHASRF